MLKLEALCTVFSFKSEFTILGLLKPRQDLYIIECMSIIELIQSHNAQVTDSLVYSVVGY